MLSISGIRYKIFFSALHNIGVGKSECFLDNLENEIDNMIKLKYEFRI